MSALAEALVAAQAELPTALPRDSQGVGCRYASLDKLIEATRPILNKHGLSISQWPSYVLRGEEGAMPVLETWINHVEGGSISNSMPLYLTDKSMQGLGAAISYARRYAWAVALGIASEEDTDGVLPADTTGSN